MFAGGGLTMNDEIVPIVRAAIQRVGWSETARRAGVDRVTLHRCFGARPNGRGPQLSTLLAILPHVGLSLTVKELNQ